MAPGLQRMNHLLFADDCLLFIKAELCQLHELKSLLESYERVVGQQVNVEKTEFTCSPNIEGTLKVVLSSFLEMKYVNKRTRYLGLPTVVGQNRTKTFKELEEKLSRKIQDWKHLTLSWVGKEILIKACL